MSEKVRTSRIEETPAPNSYNPQHMYSKARKSLTMYSNRVDFSKSDTKWIGPGQYCSSEGPKAHLGTMSKGKRELVVNKNVNMY